MFRYGHVLYLDWVRYGTYDTEKSVNNNCDLHSMTEMASFVLFACFKQCTEDKQINYVDMCII